VSDSCFRGSAKDISGENLHKLIETGKLYVNLIFFMFLLHYKMPEIVEMDVWLV